LSRWQLSPQQIEVRNIKKVNLKGGTVIDGFPSGGLTNSIASTCFMRSVKNELIAVLDSPVFPPLSVIYDGFPNFPARIYANEDIKLAMFLSELNLDQSMYYSISRTILQWAKENECELIISAGTILGEESTGSLKEPDLQNIYTVASTERAREKLKNVELVSQFSSGSVTGIPALLLNQGAWMNFDVIVLISKLSKDVSEFRAAALVSEAIMRLIPGLSCDINLLLNQAKIIEQELRKMRIDQTNSSTNLYR
jgi:uncharacterized protein